MTTYTPQQARELAGLALDHGTMAGVVESLADQVEALQSAIKRQLSDMGKQADELRAERDSAVQAAKYAEHIDATSENKLQTMLYDTLKERDAALADAERYRWLRDSKNWDEDGLCPIVASGEDTIYGEHLDAAIDTVRAAS